MRRRRQPPPRPSPEAPALTEDADLWFPVQFKWHELWTANAFRVLVVSEPPAIKRAASRQGSGGVASRWPTLARLLLGPPATAEAGQLSLPRTVATNARDPRQMREIEDEIVRTVSLVLRRDRREVSLEAPLTGPDGPRYVERIEIVERLERTFDLAIPDEHWKYLNTVGELVDYVQKRIVYRAAVGRPAAGERSETPKRAGARPAVPTGAVPVTKWGKPDLTDRPVFKR